MTSVRCHQPRPCGHSQSGVVTTAALDRHSHQRQFAKVEADTRSALESFRETPPRYLRTGETGTHSHTRDIRQRELQPLD